MKRELRNAQRKKQRIMRRVGGLGNEDIVQVLLERGMQLTGLQGVPAAKAKGKAKGKAKAKAAPDGHHEDDADAEQEHPEAPDAPEDDDAAGANLVEAAAEEDAAAPVEVEE